MPLTLYPYQVESIKQLRDGFKQHQRQILCLPTGGGKTVVFSTIVEAAVRRGTRTLVLTDRLELFKQTLESIESFGIPVCKINKDNRYMHPDATMFIGMVETVKRRFEQLSKIPFALIICDEAHSAAFNKIFEFWPKAHVIGATATPIGKHLYGYYSNLVSCVDTPELINKGFLSPCLSFQMQDDLSDLQKDKRGEFSDASLYSHYNRSKLYEGVIDRWQEKCLNTKTIVFNVNVEHTKKMTEAFNAAGIKSYCIHSDTDPKERAWIMNEFENGSFHVLNNCGILTKGYNCKPILSVIINRATMSLALYHQMVGRGSRIFAGKSYFVLLDFGLNIDRHGLWDSPRQWKLEPPKKRRSSVGAAPMKTCKCGAMLPAMIKECRYCGFIFERTEKELAQGKLVEMTNRIRSEIPGRYVSDLSIAELIECEKTKTLKSTYVWRVLRSRGDIHLQEYARLKGYRDQWTVRQLEALEAEIQSGHPVQFADKKINELATHQI